MNLRRALAVRQPADFLETDAVLGRYRAAVGSQWLIHALVARRVVIAVFARRDEKVQVAIGHVTKRDTHAVGPAFGDVFLDGRNVGRHVANRQAHVIEIERRLDERRLEVFANLPDGTCLCRGFRDDGVVDQTFFQRIAQYALEAGVVCIGIAAFRLKHDIEGVVARQRRPMPVLSGDGTIVSAPHDFEGAKVPGKFALQFAQETDDVVDAVHRDECILATRRLREEPQHGAGNDTQRTLAANEDLFHVVAGVVFQHAIHGRHNRSVGHYGV